MADFRKWIFALAVVVLLAGFSMPASAQSSVNCNNGGATPPLVRAEGLTELMGDLVLTCSGGPNGTPANQVVPQINITIILSVTITSKLTAGNLYNEALLIIDEPNQAAPGPNSNRPILNCGQNGAPDTSVESGPGVCSIVSDGNPSQTYNGVPNKFGVSGVGLNGAGLPNFCNGATPAGGAVSPGPNGTFIDNNNVLQPRANSAANTYGCGSPNVFQGRQGNPFNTGLVNNISFLGVPFDPPGTSTTRTLRFTNIRGNANQDQIASTFIQVPITAQVAINGNAPFGINVPSQGQNVAFVQRGLITSVIRTRFDFVQCNSENGALAAGSRFPPGSTGFGGPNGGGANGGGTGANPFSATPTVRFQEGFPSSWKVRNVSEILANGSFVNANTYLYNGGTSNPPDLNQNVPGVSYNTEAGFEYVSSQTTPNPNPPAGYGTGATGAINGGFPLIDTTTGIAAAGVATQGTRLFMSFSNVPTGSAVFVAPVIYFYRQNSSVIPVPATFTSGVSTGVAVLVTTDAAGDTAFNPVGGGNLVAVSSNLAVYEVLFEDANSLEQVDVPVVVAFVSNLSANPPGGLPVTGSFAQVVGGFAPFYTSAAAGLPATTSSFPIPRFVPGNAPANIFEIQKCACDLLFPFVVSSGGFDTGIAIANTSLDPGATFGFFATPQQGAVTFFYFGIGNNGTAPPASQTSGIVPAGQVLTYVVSSGGGAIGNNANGLDNRASGFQGYVIAQAQFQYCHAYAFVSALNGGPTGQGVSEGYLGLILDNPGLNFRTSQSAESLVH